MSDHLCEFMAGQLVELGRRLRDTLLESRRVGQASLRGSVPEACQVMRESAADTIYQIDTLVEPVLEGFCQTLSLQEPLILIAEGLEGGFAEGAKSFPLGSDPAQARWRLLVDPIDGTRMLMHEKRSAWVLAGLAPNRGPATSLADIQIAAQVEIPTSKQGLSDLLWAWKGSGLRSVRERLSDGFCQTLDLRPSSAPTLAHGFGSVFSPLVEVRALAAELWKALLESEFGTLSPQRLLSFEDAYLSTGGQLYELIAGHDRLVADLRPQLLAMAGFSAGLTAHPYDLATALLAQEAGVVLTDGRGRPLDGPLDTTSSIAWIGYANPALRERLEPVIRSFFLRGGT